MSLAFYRRHPEMVRALVICDSGPGYRNADARADWNRRADARAADLEARGLEVLGGAAATCGSPSAAIGRPRGSPTRRGACSPSCDAGIIDSLPDVRVPTLVIVGDRDGPFIAPCEYMAKKIPGARLEIIKDAGHSSNLDQPEAFNRVLRGFLDGLP